MHCGRWKDESEPETARKISDHFVNSARPKKFLLGSAEKDRSSLLLSRNRTRTTVAPLIRQNTQRLPVLAMLIQQKEIMMRAYGSWQSTRGSPASAGRFRSGSAGREAARLFEGSRRSALDLARRIALSRMRFGSTLPDGLQRDRPR